jgi:transcriptional regulator with XRE-family HTH domain
MLSKCRRKRVRFMPVDCDDFRYARERLGWSVDRCAAFLQVHVRTLQNWERGRVRIPYSAFRLLRVRAGLAAPANGWDGWFFGADGVIWSPEGRSFLASEMSYLSLVFAMARAWRKVAG